MPTNDSDDLGKTLEEHGRGSGMGLEGWGGMGMEEATCLFRAWNVSPFLKTGLGLGELGGGVGLRKRGWSRNRQVSIVGYRGGGGVERYLESSSHLGSELTRVRCK